MKNYKETPIKILSQGSPVVNHAIIISKSKSMVAISVDLQSKYCKILCTTYTGYTGNTETIQSIILYATEDSLYLDPSKTLEDNTEFFFEDFKDWNYHSYNLSRYTLNVCLIKP